MMSRPARAGDSLETFSPANGEKVFLCPFIDHGSSKV